MPRFQDLHREFLRCTLHTKIAHHAIFEIEAATRFLGEEPQGGMTDVKLLAYLDNENRQLSLEALTSEFLPDMVGFKDMTKKGAMRVGWSSLGYAAIAQRNSQDAIATFKLARLLAPRLHDDTRTLYATTIERALFTIARVRARGWRVSRGWVEPKIVRYEREADTLEAQIPAMPAVMRFIVSQPKPELKLSSRKQLPLLLASLGIDTGSRQDNNEDLMSTGVSSLKSVAKKHPIVPKIIRWATLKDLTGKFCLL